MVLRSRSRILEMGGGSGCMFPQQILKFVCLRNAIFPSFWGSFKVRLLFRLSLQKTACLCHVYRKLHVYAYSVHISMCVQNKGVCIPTCSLDPHQGTVWYYIISNILCTSFQKKYSAVALAYNNELCE